MSLLSFVLSFNQPSFVVSVFLICPSYVVYVFRIPYYVSSIFNLLCQVNLMSSMFFCLKSSSTFFYVLNFLSLVSFVFCILFPLFCGFSLLIHPSSMVSVFKLYVLCVMVRAFVFLGILLYLVYALIVFWKYLSYVILELKME
jgi:hypothetical protein